MSAALLENFDLLAASVGGVARLRELILSLAVRGRLVPQDPNDEPASELLKRIRVEKDRLIKEGKIKRDKPLSEIAEDERPYELPTSWEWVRLADLVAVLNGRAYKQHELLEAGTPVLRVGNLFTSSHWYYSDLTLEDDKYCEEGDLLFAWSASFGPFIWSGPKAIYHYHIWKLNLHSPANLNKHYIYNFLQEKTQELKAGGHGVSMVHMTKDSMEKTLTPLPPLAEQSRIVAKVEELMALCDRLESEQGHAARLQGHWVDAALDQLAESADADEFRHHWQHLAAHFDTLFTTPESIDRLDATLLQLAVRGKLVPQDPNDKPASELLKQIRAEKDRLIKEGKIKRDKLLPPISDDEHPHELPEGWACVRFGDYCHELCTGPFGSMIHKEDYISGGIPLINPSHMVGGHIVPDLDVSLPRHKARDFSAYMLAEGDVVLARRGEVGRYAVVTAQESGWLCGTGSFFVKFATQPNRAFLGLLFSSKEIRTHLRGASVGTTMVNLNQKILLEMAVAIPPLAEQSRIVAQVEKLQSLTASLKARLTAAQTKQAHLAEALIAALTTTTPDEPNAEERLAKRAQRGHGREAEGLPLLEKAAGQ